MHINPLKKTPLPKLLANLIIEEIQNATICIHLPGYRKLMEQFNVSQTTVKSAIKILEQQGVISAPDKGRKRTILLQPGDTPKRNKRLLVLHVKKEFSSEFDQRSTQKEIQSWKQNMGEVSIHALPQVTRQPSKTIERLLKQYNPDAILSFVLPGDWNSVIMQTNTPIYMLGGNLGPKYSPRRIGSGYSQEEASELALSKLKKRGHSRILYPIHPVHLIFKQHILSAFHRVFPELGQVHSNAFFPTLSEDLPDVWQSFLQQQYFTLKPTAIVLNRFEHLLSVMSFCLLNNISIPDDLSIVCEFDTSNCAWITPEPTRMAYPLQAQHKHFINWMESDCTSTDHKFFPMTWVEGKTIQNISSNSAG